MAFRNSGKTKLSKGILEMKFMKRSKDKVMADVREEEGRQHFGNQITDGLNAAIGTYIMEQSYIPCEELIEGRLSYRGMNPEIERIMHQEELAKRKPVDRTTQADISDVEMAQFKQSLVETIASKYKTKQNRSTNEKTRQFPTATDKLQFKPEGPPRKKAKFIKPSDD